MKDKMPLVSIIIVLYNCKDYISNCIASLSKIDYPKFEVIILDNSSEDDSLNEAKVKALEYPYLRITFLKEDKNLGFAGGNNKAIRYAKGEIVVLLNPDTTVKEDWLKCLVKAMVSNDKVGIAGCKILYPDGKTIQHAGGIIHPNGLTDHYGYGEIDKGQYEQVKEVDYITGAAFAIKREVFNKIGLLDEDYFPAYFEETDFCLKARKSGYKILYIPTAVVYHYESSTIGVFSYKFLHLYHKNRLKFIFKNLTAKEIFQEFLPYEFRWLRKKPLKSYVPLIHAYLELIGFIPLRVLKTLRVKKGVKNLNHWSITTSI